MLLGQALHAAVRHIRGVLHPPERMSIWLFAVPRTSNKVFLSIFWVVNCFAKKRYSAKDQKMYYVDWLNFEVNSISREAYHWLTKKSKKRSTTKMKTSLELIVEDRRKY